MLCVFSLPKYAPRFVHSVWSFLCVSSSLTHSNFVVHANARFLFLGFCRCQRAGLRTSINSRVTSLKSSSMRAMMVVGGFMIVLVRGLYIASLAHRSAMEMVFAFFLSVLALCFVLLLVRQSARRVYLMVAVHSHFRKLTANKPSAFWLQMLCAHIDSGLG